MPVDICKTANQRCRQAMAALRAQMQGEINQLGDSCRTWMKSYGEMTLDRDQWKGRAERTEANLRQAEEECKVATNALSLRDQEIERAEKELAALKQQAPADREAFEKWRFITGHPHSLQREGDGYKDSYTNATWRAWQAALAHKPQPWIPCSERMPTREDETIWLLREELRIANEIIEAHKQPWIPCSERMPTREDGDSEGKVLRLCVSGYIESVRWDNFGKATHWMPIPPSPTAPTAEKVPTPPEGFHVATEEERKCLPVGYQYWSTTYSKWRKGSFVKDVAGEYDIIVCPNLATFTAGKINPPPYGSWHRSDWTPEMLPDGWRPLLDGEPCEAGDKVLVMGGWSDGIDTGFKMSRQHLPTCTRRPLPPAPEKEKEPEWVPLEACDVPPGSAIRWPNCSWLMVGIASHVGIRRACEDALIEWVTLMNGGAEISRDNGKTWEACKKINRK